MHTYVFFLDKRCFCFSAPEPGSHGSLLKGVFPPTVTECSDFWIVSVIVGSLP